MVNRLVSVGDDNYIAPSVLIGDVNLPPGAGVAAVSGKVAKGDLMFNIKDYGAVGDGVANDGAFIQAAVNDAIAAKRALYWPAGTYLKTVSIANFHLVKHRGEGVVKHGSSLFYVEPRGIQANTLYVSAAGATDTYDGLDASVPLRTTNKAVNYLPNYGPVLQGFWAIQLTGHTYADRVVAPAGINSVSPITIRGPIVDHPNVPTAVFREGYNIGAVALKLADTKTGWIISNIKFEGYNGTSSSAGVQVSSTSDETYLINCHFVDCFWGATNQNSSMDIKGGIFTRCGFLGDTANNVAISLRNGNGGGYRGLMGSRHSIGTQSSGDNLKGPFFYSCRSGVFAQETCTGHVDWCVIEDCDIGVNLNVSSRANVDGTAFKRNNVDLRGTGNSHFYISSNTSFGTGADESQIKVSLSQGSQATDASRIFTNVAQSYSTSMKIVDTQFPAQSIQTTGQTVFYTATLGGMVWRDALSSSSERKRIALKIYGELLGAAGTKQITMRLGSSTVSITFTAAEEGKFEAEGVVFFTDLAAQFVTLKGFRHMGAGVRATSGTMANPLTSATNLTAEASVGVDTDAIRVDAVDMSWG